jgi:hypothetical protein
VLQLVDAGAALSYNNPRVKASRFHCGHIFINLVHGVPLGFDLGNDDLIAPWIFVAWN